LVGGYFGGWVDGVVNRLTDLLFSLPGIVVLLAVSSVFGKSTLISMGVLGVLLSAAYIRLARASTLAVKNELYVDAARVSGISQPAIIFGHVLPNAVGPLIVQSSLTMGAALLIQSGLGFLGLGPTPPAPSWGGMIAEASSVLFQQSWLMVPTGVVLALSILSVNLIGDALRDGDEQHRTRSLLTRTRPTAASVRVPVPAESLLSVQDLKVTFGTAAHGTAAHDTAAHGTAAYSTDVVRGITFAINRRETVGLVGESGSGKTMTALAILGLLPSPGTISQGQIVFDGRNLVELDDKKLAQIRGKRIAMISQEPMVALDPSFTIGSQLMAPLRRHRGMSKRQARAEARSLLELVRIPRVDQIMRSYPHQLSGGMAQRVAIAIALTGRPDLLIADEPTTALDVTVQAGILDLLRDLQDQMGMAILLVTHDLGVVADICSRAVVMREGLIVESAGVDELFGQPEHEYTKTLIGSTPSLVVIKEQP
jgi:peptide/nickel transport system permease protein